MFGRSALTLWAFLAAAAHAEQPPPPADPLAPEPKAEADGLDRPRPADGAQRMRLSDRIDYRVDPDAYSIISTVKGLSTHRSTYLYPFTYSSDYHNKETEVVFQFSAKQRLFGTNLYVGYTQKSFWQLYNGAESKPFRDTNYNPELFYRWILDPERFRRWSVDVGYEHESNGQSVPNSRSWDRLYIAPFQAKGKQLAYLKLWWRIPEDDEPSSPTNPDGDDNPDITDFYGYGEFTFSRQIGRKQLLTAMLRGNPDTGHGAVNFTWSMPTTDLYAFYGVSLFHGYGESLLDYNTSVTRLSIGLMLAR